MELEEDPFVTATDREQQHSTSADTRQDSPSCTTDDNHKTSQDCDIGATVSVVVEDNSIKCVYIKYVHQHSLDPLTHAPPLTHRDSSLSHILSTAH